MCPRLLTIYGPIAVQSYGFMIVVGLLAFLALTYFHPRRIRLISGEMYINVVFVALLAGVIGGRILGVIADWQAFKDNPIEIFFPWVGGFVVLGAIVGIVCFMPLYLMYNRIPVLELFDFAAVYAPMLQAIARFGCLLAGCCYGAITDPSWWSIVVTNPEAHMPAYMLGYPLIPTQIFSAAASGLIFLVMLFLQKRFVRLGQAVFFYLLSENIARFVVDFWRGDRGILYPIFGMELSQFQIYSLLFFCVSFIGFVGFSCFGKKVTQI